jgi:hypothetical protein
MSDVVQSPRLRARDLGALVLLLAGPFMLLIGWLVGAWLLWTSDRWSRREKLLGTAALPVAYCVAVFCDFFQLPMWLILPIAVLFMAVPILVLFLNGRPREQRG